LPMRGCGKDMRFRSRTWWILGIMEFYPFYGLHPASKK
jgi:hypothetical protein